MVLRLYHGTDSLANELGSHRDTLRLAAHMLVAEGILTTTGEKHRKRYIVADISEPPGCGGQS